MENSPYRGHGIPSAAPGKKKDWRPYYRSHLGILIIILSLPLIILQPFLFVGIRSIEPPHEMKSYFTSWSFLPGQPRLDYITDIIELVFVLSLGPISWVPILLGGTRDWFCHPLLRTVPEWENEKKDI